MRDGCYILSVLDYEMKTWTMRKDSSSCCNMPWACFFFLIQPPLDVDNHESLHRLDDVPNGFRPSGWISHAIFASPFGHSKPCFVVVPHFTMCCILFRRRSSSVCGVQPSIFLNVYISAVLSICFILLLPTLFSTLLCFIFLFFQMMAFKAPEIFVTLST